ncbi:MAG TPA: hypothetical protein VL120_14950 [Solirubrobacteraceae bacterium]|nr:hypothetical protein [Solirubrobacteraceae bacterium]
MQVDDLYGLAPDRFVPERAALARALRADGRRDEAAAVAKLRRPSAAAWVVNQLVRGSADGVAELFAAGDALRAAQSALLAGRGDGAALREAGARERAAVDALLAAVPGRGGDASTATLERVADTLHAAALDEAARDAVRDGRLERELRHAGLGLGEGADVFAAAPVPKATPRATPGEKPTGEPKRDAAAERKAAKERAAAETAAKAEREAARKQARFAVAQAAKAEERAGHALRAAQERRDRAARALEEADAALAEAQAKVEAAGEEHRRARAELDGG